MSKENEKTIEIYKKKAHVYIETCIKHDNLSLDKAKSKREGLEKFIKKNISAFPKGAKVFEIGSGDGSNAKYIEKLGYEVTASDIAEDFIKLIKFKDLKTVEFNILKDGFKDKYSAVFCWRVFVHFTKEDALLCLQKVHDALEDNGIFIFNVINRETKNVDDEWVDFPNEYHMGAERYYNYYNEEELNKIVTKVGYQILDFHKEGGENNNKWLVYVLKK